MQVLYIDEASLLPEAVDRVTDGIRESVRKASVSCAESRDAQRAGDENLRIIRNAEAISLAGLSLEQMLSILLGEITNTRYARPEQGSRGHSLARIHDSCLDEVSKHSESKIKALEEAFRNAYQDAVNSQVTEIKIDGKPAGGTVILPFSSHAKYGAAHGEIKYDEFSDDKFLSGSSTAREGFDLVPENLRGYLELFDRVAEEFRDGKAGSEASWRSMDYHAREDLSSRPYLNAEFFSILAHNMLGITRDRYFWHQDYLDAILESEKLLFEEKALGMIRSNWPKEVHSKVSPILRGSIDLTRRLEHFREAPNVKTPRKPRCVNISNSNSRSEF